MSETGAGRAFDIAVYHPSGLEKLANLPGNCQAPAGDGIEKAGRDPGAGRPAGIVEDGYSEASLPEGPGEDCPGQSSAHHDDIDVHQWPVNR